LYLLREAGRSSLLIEGKELVRVYGGNLEIGSGFAEYGNLRHSPSRNLSHLDPSVVTLGYGGYSTSNIHNEANGFFARSNYSW
jgi:hypothetical protein